MYRIVAMICAASSLACGGASTGMTRSEPVTTPAAPARQAKWSLDWADEFDGATLDANNWIAVDGASNVNNELQYYTPTDVYLEGGSLVLRSQRRTFGLRQYSSGEVRSGTKRTVHVGNAIEWRTQIPSGKGIWPANWLVNTPCDGINGCGGNWPPEIDVMELRGSTPDNNLMTHWWGAYPNMNHQTSEYSGTTLSTGYHTYRVECFPDSILWYIDGVQRAKHSSNILVGVLQLVMNTAVGGDFDGNPTPATTFPQYHRIDYVRVYRDTANVY
jgi:beta-glucanase (GH16 family)